MLSLSAGGRGLALSQLNVPGFVDSQLETLPHWEEWMERRLGEEEQEEGWDRELWLECKTKFKKLIRRKEVSP